MSRFPESRTSARDRPGVTTPRRRRPPRRTGHRQEHAATPVTDQRRSEPRRSFQDRLQASILDIALHRAVAARDLVEHQFGGHPYAGRRGIEHLKKAGLVTENETRNPETARTDRYLIATPAGERLAAKVARERGLDPEQRTWSSTPKRADLHHDLALYRAIAAARQDLLSKGFHVRRIRLDAEVRGQIVRRSEAVRARQGPAAADQVRRDLARQHHLPVDDNGRILYPDAQLEYAASPDAPTTARVNIDIVTDQYRAASIAAKSAAGFVLAPSGPRAARNLAAALRNIGTPGTDRSNTPSGGRRGGSPGGLLDF